MMGKLAFENLKIIQKILENNPTLYKNLFFLILIKNPKKLVQEKINNLIQSKIIVQINII